jgi:hypothetical protein
MPKATPWMMLVLALLTMGEGGAGALQVSMAIRTALRPWVRWVLDGEEGKRAVCLSHVGDFDAVCVRPARLALDLRRRGGTFRQEWTILNAGFTALPGCADHWQRDAKLNGRRVPTVDRDGEPRLFLRTGRHVVIRAFAWDSLPEALTIPPETGLIDLTKVESTSPESTSPRLWSRPDVARDVALVGVDTAVGTIGRAGNGDPFLCTPPSASTPRAIGFCPRAASPSRTSATTASCSRRASWYATREAPVTRATPTRGRTISRTSIGFRRTVPATRWTRASPGTTRPGISASHATRPRRAPAWVSRRAS